LYSLAITYFVYFNIRKIEREREREREKERGRGIPPFH